MSYQDFLERRTQLDGDHGFEPIVLPEWLFPFQRDLVVWAIRKGRGAIFADCGMGKTPMALTWAENVVQHTWRPVLIVCPLAVAGQIVAEAKRFGFNAAISRDGTVTAGITVTNYDRLHHFNPGDFAGVVCDESSAIKAFDGERRREVTAFMRKLPYRLLCTATAAPNDYIELGTSSEALGQLGAHDMLSRFFVNDDSSGAAAKRSHGMTPKWRFKGHADEPFWRWVSSWSRAIRRPSDYGYSDEGFALPELIHREHVVGEAVGPTEYRTGKFTTFGIREWRDECRQTLDVRCEKTAEIVQEIPDYAVVWCHLNAEGDLLERLIHGAVQVSGSDRLDVKEERLAAFSRGEIRVLISKPGIAGFGLNWQHCNRIVYSPSWSYEQYYQAVRRCWRFGQTRQVEVDVVTSPGGAGVLQSLARKSEQADRMFTELVAHMNNALHVDRSTSFDVPIDLPTWMKEPAA